MVEGDASGMAELKRLYEEHAAFVRQLLARLLGPGGDVDDCAHEVFMVAWRRRSSIEKGAVRAWLAGVALKLAQASRRRSRIRRFLGLEAIESLSSGPSPAEIFENREASRIVYAALDRLSEKKRTVFVLHELQGLSGPEIARMLGCNAQTVKTRLFHARHELMAELQRWKQAEDARSQRQELSVP
jgi:RNA polymerase sigma-70 factor (ECF subfamily)